MLTLVVKGQYHVINDSDGFVNVRESPDISGKIICPLNNGMVVFETWNEDASHNNWIFVEFYVPKKDAGNIRKKPEEWIPEVMNGYSLFSGWIYKDRLMAVNKQKEFKKKWTDKDFVLYNDSINIKFRSKEFDKTKHEIEIKDQYGVVKIDGHHFIGTDGGIPRYEIQSLQVEINHNKIEIPRTCYYDLYEPNFNRFTDAYIDDGGTIYLTMYNSDAAGSYEVIFIIKDNKYFGRYVFHGEC